jgi:CRP/FNR family transcriptional regulator, cyclic AMP receptor protein
MVVRSMGAVEPLPLVVIRPGQSPVRQGEPCAGVWRIETGLLALESIDADGRSLLVDVLGPGDTVGGPDGHVAAWTATALRPARLFAVGPRDAAAAVAAQIARLTWIAAGFAWFPVPERVFRRLVDLAERHGRPVPGGVQLPCALTQDQLASMVGASRESVNRALMAMVRTGAIEVRGRGRYVLRSSLRLVET